MERVDLHPVLADARQRHRQQAGSAFAIERDLQITDQLLRLVDPEIRNGADHLPVVALHRQSPRVAPRRHMKMLGHPHRHDLRVALAVKLRHVSAQRISGRPHAVDQGIPGGFVRRSVRSRGAPERQLSLAVGVAVWDRHVAAPMGKLEGLGRRNCEQTLVRGGIPVFILQRVAFAHILRLQVIYQTRAKNNQNRYSATCARSTSPTNVSVITVFLSAGAASGWKLGQPEPGLASGAAHQRADQNKGEEQQADLDMPDE